MLSRHTRPYMAAFISIRVGILLAGLLGICAVQAASMPTSESEPAVDCSNPQTTLEINACLKTQQEQTEAQLNKVYREVLTHISDDGKLFTGSTNMKQQFIAAQRAWIVFREKDCEAIYTFWSDGTIRNAQYLMCMRSRAEQRIKELQAYMQP